MRKNWPVQPMTSFLLPGLHRAKILILGFSFFSYGLWANTLESDRGPVRLVKHTVSKKKKVKMCVGPGRYKSMVSPRFFRALLCI